MKNPLLFIYLLMLSTANLIAQPTPLQINWKVAGELPAPDGQSHSLGVAGPLTGVHHNVLLVAGGANFPGGMPWLGGQKKYYKEGFVFRKDEHDSLISMTTFLLPQTLAYAACCSTPQGVVIAGGENESGLQNAVLLLQWNEARQSVLIKGLPALPFAVTNASLVYHQHKIYLAGGERQQDVSSELLVLDLTDTASGWQKLSVMLKPVSHAILVVQSNSKDNCLYLLGGRKRNNGRVSDLYASVYQYSLKKGTWTEKQSLPYALSAGTGNAIGTHSILLFGGDRGETFHKTENLIIAIAGEKDSLKKAQLTEEKSKVQSSHPGFSRQILLYDTKKDQWVLDGHLPFSTPATTTAVMWNGDFFLPSGEIKAGVRTPQILMGKLNISK